MSLQQHQPRKHNPPAPNRVTPHPKGALQDAADHSPAHAHLTALQRMADTRQLAQDDTREDVTDKTKSPEETQPPDAAYSDPTSPDAPADLRKRAAADKLKDLMAGAAQTKDSLTKLLQVVADRFHLSAARVEGEGKTAKVALYASPALFIPLTTAPISGQFAGATAAGRTSVANGDYIRATNYDGPFEAPGKQAFDQIESRFNGVPTFASTPATVSAGSKKKKKGDGSALASTVPNNPGSEGLWTQYEAGTYMRAGTVEALTSVKRGAGRSGTGETIFGRFGYDEEVILSGMGGFYNGGHMVGDQLMDSKKAFSLYEDWNLVPQVATFNSPVYTSALENPIVRAVEAGAQIRYTVRVQYPDSTYTVLPSVLIARLYAATDSYRTHVEAALTYDPTLNAPFTFRRRVPGFWQATAEVVTGPNISSGNIKERFTEIYDDDATKVAAGATYTPTGFERVRYMLETDDDGTGYTVSTGPQPVDGVFGKSYDYDDQAKVQMTARQKTLS
ncbi:DNA/RNA non-specific endonuclease [Yoonia sp. I 8.24]|uniref:DNA/RNA non-specific endonuclease n=1 Tax=Yoonia sp. I 8.24 TaxID=1537229 RepID=UPI001EDCDEDA|nr:DNA/RNA non-specific endonuclease [Yoonia sp. I 8.24]MCG3266295.1 hypothetical protein [Yoonia sp. I 8.24]